MFLQKFFWRVRNFSHLFSSKIFLTRQKQFPFIFLNLFLTRRIFPFIFFNLFRSNELWFKMFLTCQKFSVIFWKNFYAKIQHSSDAESKRWLAGPNMSYWPQQLNFAVWRATTGCGISREILDKVPEQIKSFLMFHIYFTVRRILFKMGGVQSESALLGDPTFS